MKSYHGAGILFFARQEKGCSILLAQRKRSGVWSIPGGGRHHSDSDAWSTAFRETTEEFGSVPDPHHQRFPVVYPFGIFGFTWTTFAVELAHPPSIPIFPDKLAMDFTNEFRDAAWFPIRELPNKTHWLLYPAIWRLRLLYRLNTKNLS